MPLRATDPTPALSRPLRGAAFAALGSVLLALALDAAGVALVPAFPAVRALHLAALVCLALAATLPSAFRDLEAWSTPFDGLVLASLAIAAMGAVPEHGDGPYSRLLEQVLGCAGVFFGATLLLRRAAAGDLAWRALALGTALLGAHALWAATGGVQALAAQSAAADAHWAGRHGLARALAFCTLATLGRAAERGAPPAWRLASAIGLVGLALHAAAGGFAMESASLARLDHPLEFSVVSVTWLAAAVLGRVAWSLRRERRAEAQRWRFMALAGWGLGVACAFGDGTGGEGVRALAVLAAAGALAARDEPQAAAKSADPPAEEPLARAA